MTALLRCSFVAMLGLVSAIPCMAEEAFPKPHPEKTFPELKIYDGAGHPWRVAQEDWEGARLLVRTDPAWTAWLKRERTAIERWMERHHDRVEWRCGWWHNFVSPKDGSHLVWTEEIPGEEVEYLHSHSDPRVEITPKIFASWVFSFRGNHANMMQRAAGLYRLEGDERYAAWAAAQLDYYADHYLEWPENREGSRLYWQTLDVATNMVQYAATVRLLGDYVSAERRTKWLQSFFRPQVDVLNRTQHNIHNIATWHRCAVMQTALVFDDPTMWRGALEGEFGFRQQIARGITSDYLWYEQSFGYNSYVVRAVLSLFTTAGIYGRQDELAKEMTATENLMLSPIYLRFPDGRAPNPADNAGAPLRVPDLGTLSAAYRVFPTSLGYEKAAAAHTWEALVDPIEPVLGGRKGEGRQAGEKSPLVGSTSTISLPAVTSRNLESSRMAMLIANGWQVLFHYGQLTRSHAQAEALNYAAFYGNADITHDPGTVGYGSPLHREYYTRGLSHNLPLVNGEGQEPPQSGELLVYSTDPARVSARQPMYRKDADAERTLAIVGRTLVDTTTVTSKTGSQKLGLALHLQGKTQLPADFIADATFAANRPKSFGYWRNVRRATFRDRADIDMDCAGTTIRIAFEAPGEFTLWQGSAPDVPPKRRDAFFLELTAPVASATFKTTFSPER